MAVHSYRQPGEQRAHPSGAPRNSPKSDPGFRGQVSRPRDAAAGGDDQGVVTPEYRDIRPEDISQTSIVQFNDLVGVEDVLRQGDVALILTEPAMTNVGIIRPAPGFHSA